MINNRERANRKMVIIVWKGRRDSPSNIVGLTGVMHDLVSDGNSVILVDHDTQILKEADWIVEMGPEAGANGGHVIAQGTIADVEENPTSQIGPFISGKAETKLRECAIKEELFANGNIHLSTSQIHTVKPLKVCLLYTSRCV